MSRRAVLLGFGIASTVALASAGYYFGLIGQFSPETLHAPSGPLSEPGGCAHKDVTAKVMELAKPFVLQSTMLANASRDKEHRLGEEMTTQEQLPDSQAAKQCQLNFIEQAQAALRGLGIDMIPTQADGSPKCEIPQPNEQDVCLATLKPIEFERQQCLGRLGDSQHDRFLADIARLSHLRQQAYSQAS